jgi:peroxiredoxin
MLTGGIYSRPMANEEMDRQEGEEQSSDDSAGDPASSAGSLPAAVGGGSGPIVVSAEEIRAAGVEPIPGGGAGLGGGASQERGRPPIKLKTWQVVAIALLALFTIFITWRVKRLEKSVLERTSASVMISRSAPEFALPALSGDTVSLADYRGKKTLVVSYWASWCGPCKVELPELREFYKRYHKADANFEILAISIDEEKADAEKYAAAEKLPFPVLFDPQSKTADAYSVEGIPTLFVINKDGKIVHAHAGLVQAIQMQLMGELGLKYSDTETGGEVK